MEIWNQSLWCNSIVVSCNDCHSRMHLHNHKKQQTRSNSTRIWSTILCWWLRNSYIKYTIIKQYTLWKGTNFALNNKEEVYNLCLSVDVLLHKANISSPIAPTCSIKLTLLICWVPKCAFLTTSLIPYLSYLIPFCTPNRHYFLTWALNLHRYDYLLFHLINAYDCYN